MSAADELRTAAERLETYADYGRCECAQCSAKYAARDRAMAALLREVADRAEHHIEAWQRPGGADEPPARYYNDPDGLARNIEHHYGRALAVARVVSGEPS